MNHDANEPFDSVDQLLTTAMRCLVWMFVGVLIGGVSTFLLVAAGHAS